MRALALFSGGLDSMLAIKIISLANIEVIALFMDIGFASKEDLSAILKQRALEAGAKDFKLIDLKSKYLQDVLFSPRYGYGKHFNPCIDCHAFMFKTALSMLADFKADFIISGEVLGQRPMSQRADALIKVQNLAKDEDELILRPLSAKLLNPSKPIKEGWISIDKLYSISGRSRKIQLELAKKFHFTDYASPSGGCFLTLEKFASKIKDLIKYKKTPSVSDLQLLKFGRHFRLRHGSKLIIGRNEAENEQLLNLKDENYEQIDLGSLIGAVSLIEKGFKSEDIDQALELVLAYSKAKIGDIYELVLMGVCYKIQAKDKENAKAYLI